MGRHRFWLVILAVFTGVLINVVIAGIVIQQRDATYARQRLCFTLVKIIRQSDASLSQFAYYKQHPSELAKAHEQTRQTIKTLDCGGL